jgi:acyl-CoA oxidase
MGIFDHALAYVKSRKQFGVPLASFQLVQERLSRMLGIIQSMVLLSWRTSNLFMSGKATSGQASLAKLYNTLRGREVAQLGREILGGNGIVQDYHVARLFSDMEALYTYEGTYDINALYARLYIFFSKV